MLADPAFREAVCERAAGAPSDGRVEPADRGGRRGHAGQRRPGAGRAAASRRSRRSSSATRSTSCSGSRGATTTTADLTWTIPGKPGEMTGTSRLHESGGRPPRPSTSTVKVAIPLVGGKLEGFIADLLVKALDAEARAGRDYLAG